MPELKSKFLNFIKQRGYYQDCTNLEGVDEYFNECEKSSKPAICYIGFDCTAESLHIGSLMQIMILKHLQNFGHKPIVLLGGGTTRIGDPSGKDETRKMLDDAGIERNKAGIRKVFDKYLEFEEEASSFNPNSNKAVIVDNYEWLKGLNYIDFLRDVGRHFSVNRMLSFESVKRRLDREQNLSFIEFNYMILQAYDFVELAKNYACRVQIGGSDQWGNIVNGTELHRRISVLPEQLKVIDNFEFENNHEKNSKRFKEIDEKIELEYSKKKIFGLTTPLLTTSDGAKMGKTADGAVWLNEDMLKPYDFWQYWRNVSDADTIKFIKLFTTLSDEEIAELEKLEGQEINKAKIILATEATKLCHGEQAALEAEKTAKDLFEKNLAGGDIPVIEIPSDKIEQGIFAILLFKESGLCESNGEAKRLIKGGGAKINDEKITNGEQLITKNDFINGELKLSSGKKKHVLVRISG